MILMISEDSDTIERLMSRFYYVYASDTDLAREARVDPLFLYPSLSSLKLMSENLKFLPSLYSFPTFESVQPPFSHSINIISTRSGIRADPHLPLVFISPSPPSPPSPPLHLPFQSPLPLAPLATALASNPLKRLPPLPPPKFRIRPRVPVILTGQFACVLGVEGGEGGVGDEGDEG